MGDRNNLVKPGSDEVTLWLNDDNYGFTSNVNSTGEVTEIPVPDTSFSNPDLVHNDYGFTYNPNGTAPTYYAGNVSDIAGGQSIMGVGEVNSYGEVVKPSAPTASPPPPETNWAKNLQAGASVVGATAGLANAYLGFKNYALAKKQYAFQKNVTNRNLANQALLVNEQLDRRARVGNALAGNVLTAEEKAARLDRAARNHVDGSSIQ